MTLFQFAGEKKVPQQNSLKAAEKIDGTMASRNLCLKKLFERKNVSKSSENHENDI